MYCSGVRKLTTRACVAVSVANSKTMDFIKDKHCRMIAELGVYQGHTSMAFAKYLNGEGSLHLYDFEDRVRTVAAELERAGFHNVQSFGCSYRYRDSYNWALGKAIATHGEPIYDYIFLDGAHDWAIDALATLLSDRLLKVGGYLDFDDYGWTLAESPSLNPRAFPLTAKLYTRGTDRDPTGEDGGRPVDQARSAIPRSC